MTDFCQTSFKLSHDNISRFPDWLGDLKGMTAMMSGNFLYTIHFDYKVHDVFASPFVNNALADQTDPNLLKHAPFDNPANPANPYTLEFTNTPRVSPGSRVDNMAMIQMIRANCEPLLEEILPNRCEMAQTLIRLLQSCYLNVKISQTNDLTLEWISLKHLETETIMEYWDRAGEIMSRMQAEPVAREHKPYLEFSRIVDHVIRGLLPSVFGSQIEALRNTEYATLDQLCLRISALERNMAWKPKVKHLKLCTNRSRESSRGRGHGNHGTSGPSRPHPYSSNHGSSSNNSHPSQTCKRGNWQGGDTQQRTATAPQLVPLSQKIHVLEDTGRPKTPCPICNLMHWKIQCHKHPNYAANALLPFPAGKHLVPFNRVRRDLQNEPAIKTLYSQQQHAPMLYAANHFHHVAQPFVIDPQQQYYMYPPIQPQQLLQPQQHQVHRLQQTDQTVQAQPQQPQTVLVVYGNNPPNGTPVPPPYQNVYPADFYRGQ
ncbi:hypothetical protein HDU78_001223 [Chytriomyces hyalinus]|nr:hypothetical protein HDU78_001223 [Chytriomyces hyalinus]